MTGRSVSHPGAVATAPGKLILMGEHAAVYGRPALVATIGLEARVVVESSPEPAAKASVVIDLPDLGYREEVTWRDLLDYAKNARQAWEAFSAEPTAARFRAVGADSPGHLVRVALGEVAGDIGSRDLPPLRVSVRSELPIGAGFGSSAAIALGLVSAALTTLGEKPSMDTLDRLTLEVERRQHGTPSGVDHSTILRGGVQLVTRGERLDLERIEVPKATLEGFRAFHTGTSSESTGAVVSRVRERRDASPREFDAALDRMAANVLSFGRELSRELPDWGRISEMLKTYEAWLEEIGVVPPSVARALRLAAEEGWIGKLSGAGALSDSGAGSVIVLKTNDTDVPKPLAGYQAFEAPLGVAGLNIEETG